MPASSSHEPSSRIDDAASSCRSSRARHRRRRRAPAPGACRRRRGLERLVGCVAHPRQQRLEPRRPARRGSRRRARSGRRWRRRRRSARRWRRAGVVDGRGHDDRSRAGQEPADVGAHVGDSAPDTTSRRRSRAPASSCRRASSGSAVAGAMPHRSNPSVRACALIADEVSMTRHPMADLTSAEGSSEGCLRRTRRAELQLCRNVEPTTSRDTSCRSTYGRMPPCAERRQLFGRVDAAHAPGSVAIDAVVGGGRRR